MKSNNDTKECLPKELNYISALSGWCEVRTANFVISTRFTEYFLEEAFLSVNNHDFF